MNFFEWFCLVFVVCCVFKDSCDEMVLYGFVICVVLQVMFVRMFWLDVFLFFCYGLCVLGVFCVFVVVCVVVIFKFVMMVIEDEVFVLNEILVEVDVMEFI